MNTLSKTLATAIALSVVAVGSVSARVSESDKQLQSNPAFEQTSEIATDNYGNYNANESDSVIDARTSRVNNQGSSYKDNFGGGGR